MPDNLKKITPADVLQGESPFVLTAHLEPVAGLDRFQPAGFPEIGHVIYKAPRKNGVEEPICIVDSPASMANHLESVCLRGAHDLDLVDDLADMPYVRCVTGAIEDGRLNRREAVVTSLTEGHRIASTYFLEGRTLSGDGKPSNGKFIEALTNEFGIVLPGSKKAHPPAEKWWDVFKTIFQYDPNSLVHGVLFPQWNIKIPRFLTAHHEAFGAARVDRSGVKFDRLGNTTSGQPIFAVDDAVAQKIRATFVLDASLVRSFGRKNGEKQLGLNDQQKQFLIALALWKIQRLLTTPFRFRSGCHLTLQKNGLKTGNDPVEIVVDVKDAIKNADFATDPRITDVYWRREELYREGEETQDNAQGAGDNADQAENEEEDESEG
jgi:CRISPR-associated protein Csb1